MPDPNLSRIVHLEKQVRAVQLRVAGATYEAIADRLGYPDTACAAQAVRSALMKERKEAAEHLRDIELRRLDAMHRRWWKRRGQPRAAGILLKIHRFRCKLLGLEIPVPQFVSLGNTEIGQSAADFVKRALGSEEARQAIAGLADAMAIHLLPAPEQVVEGTARATGSEGEGIDGEANLLSQISGQDFGDEGPEDPPDGSPGLPGS